MSKGQKCICRSTVPGFISPSVITGDELRPDLRLTIENKILYILEFTVGFEINLKTNSDRKHEKYLTQITDQENVYDEVKFVKVSKLFRCIW